MTSKKFDGYEALTSAEVFRVSIDAQARRDWGQLKEIDSSLSMYVLRTRDQRPLQRTEALIPVVACLANDMLVSGAQWASAKALFASVIDTLGVEAFGKILVNRFVSDELSGRTVPVMHRAAFLRRVRQLGFPATRTLASCLQQEEHAVHAASVWEALTLFCKGGPGIEPLVAIGAWSPRVAGLIESLVEALDGVPRDKRWARALAEPLVIAWQKFSQQLDRTFDDASDAGVSQGKKRGEGKTSSPTRG
jgi:hypothetical protein